MDHPPLQATQTLPAGYIRIGRLNLLKDRRLLIGMNILGLALFFLFAWLFTRLLLWLRPEAAGGLWQIAIHGWGDLLRITAVLAGLTAAVVILHEAAHGVFFWLFTGSMPHFEFKIVYAAASAPGWYLPRLQYIIVGLAPLVLLSLLGTAAMAVVPPGWLPALVAFLVFNASGAVGDLIVVAWVLALRRARLALDEVTAITLFAPGPE